MYITRTQTEKDEVIAKLTAIKNSLPEKTMFGNNNHVKYDLFIDVIKGRYDDDDIARMENAGMDDEDDDFFDDEVDELTYSDMYNLYDWLHNSNADINELLEL